MNQLKSIDISNNFNIETLLCNNNEIISVSINSNNNAKLTRVFNSNNAMGADALNTMFESLPLSGSSIVIHNNPGTSTCNISIAENKNWTVTYR
jgi:hypothetical protein